MLALSLVKRICDSCLDLQVSSLKFISALAFPALVSFFVYLKNECVSVIISNAVSENDHNGWLYVKLV